MVKSVHSGARLPAFKPWLSYFQRMTLGSDFTSLRLGLPTGKMKTAASRLRVTGRTELLSVKHLEQAHRNTTPTQPL